MKKIYNKYLTVLNVHRKRIIETEDGRKIMRPYSIGYRVGIFVLCFVGTCLGIGIITFMLLLNHNIERWIDNDLIMPRLIEKVEHIDDITIEKHWLYDHYIVDWNLDESEKIYTELSNQVFFEFIIAFLFLAVILALIIGISAVLILSNRNKLLEKAGINYAANKEKLENKITIISDENNISFDSVSLFIYEPMFYDILMTALIKVQGITLENIITDFEHYTQAYMTHEGQKAQENEMKQKKRKKVLIITMIIILAPIAIATVVGLVGIIMIAKNMLSELNQAGSDMFNDFSSSIQKMGRSSGNQNSGVSHSDLKAWKGKFEQSRNADRRAFNQKINIENRKIDQKMNIEKRKIDQRINIENKKIR